jgi:hypothetical protein
MNSNLQTRDRVNRSHPNRGALVPSARMSSACFIRVTKRDQPRILDISFSTKSLLRQRTRHEAALRRSRLFISKPQNSGGVTPADWRAR